MPSNSINRRAKQLLEQNRLRHLALARSASMTPSSSRSSPIFIPPDTPPDTPERSAKRQCTIKPEDDELPNIPKDPALLPPETLALDPKAGESELPALDDDQHRTVKLIMAGWSILLTGSAGCGKSTVIRWVVMLLRAAGKVVYVTAPTGQAASQIGGITLHSYLGWGTDVKKQPLKQVLKAMESGYAHDRIDGTDVLIVDEISMVENHMLDRINRAIQRASGKEREPFGGKQIIFSGDFFQLSPVKPFETCFKCGKEFTEIGRKMVEGKKVKTYECGTCENEAELETKCWAFNSELWNDPDLNLAYVHLRENHRQSEMVFMSILKKIRIAEPLSDPEKGLLLYHLSNALNGVRLFPNNNDARTYNEKMLNELPGMPVEYKCWDELKLNAMHAHLQRRAEKSTDGSLMYLFAHRYENLLRLKLGMPVVLLANLDVERGLVNGSQGRIIGFEAYNEASVPNAAGIDRTPNAPGAAGNDAGNVYIARRGHSEYAPIRVEQVKRFIMQKDNRDKVWPIVQLNNGKRITIFANCTMAMLGESKPYSLEMRTQIPLAPGWAMTMHKAQGMTLEKVVIDLSSAFGEGMAYVALSRAKTLGGMHVKSLGKCLEREKANAEVMGFYETRTWDVGGFR